MNDLALNVAKFLPEDCVEKAIENVLKRLGNDSSDFSSWMVLDHLLSNLKAEEKLHPSAILQVCQETLKNSDQAHLNVRIVSNVLNLLIRKCDVSVVKSELESLCSQLKSSILSHSRLSQSDEGFQEYQNACTVFSLILPALYQENILGDKNSVLEIIRTMIDSKNEKTIVEAISLILPAALIPAEGEMGIFFETVCESVKSLFNAEADEYKSNIHPGLVALCSLADLVFSRENYHSVSKETWFLANIQEGLSNQLALNRKRAQYLAKRFVDFTTVEGQPMDTILFQDFFLVLETLEEKQTHIIRPVLTKMEAIEEKILSKKQADPSWLAALYERVLLHENLQVVKWGMHKACQINVHLWPAIEKDWFYATFLQGLNHVTFYVRDSPTSVPKLGQDLIELLRKCAQLPDQERDGFFHRFLEGVSRCSWNSVALFHLTLALASIPPCQLMDGPTLQIVLEFLRSALHTQHPLLRGAIQGLILESVQNLVRISEDNLHWLCLILATIQPRECYVRNSILYSDLTRWIGRNYSSAEVSRVFCTLLARHLNPDVQLHSGYSVDVVAVARLAILILDADLADQDMIQRMQTALEPIVGCQDRPYADRDLLNQRIRLLMALVKQAHLSAGPILPEDRGRNAVLKLVAPLVDTVVEYSLLQIETSADYSTICDSLSVLESIAATEEYRPVFRQSAGRRILMARTLLDGPSALSTFKSVSLLLIQDEQDQSTDELVALMVARKIHCRPPDRQSDADSSFQVTWGVFMSHYFSQIWKLISQRIRHLATGLVVEDVVEEAVCAMDMAGVEAIKSILSCLSFLLPLVVRSSPELCRTSLELCWSHCFDYRRTDHFWSVMEHLMPVVFQDRLMSDPGVRLQLFAFLSELKTLGENVLQLFNMAARPVVDIWIGQTFPLVDDHSVQFVVDLLTFGMIHRKDEIVQFETCAFVQLMGDRFPVNINIKSEDAADGQVRFQGLRFLLSLGNEENHLKMAQDVCDALLVRDRLMAQQKTRHFASSLGHRVKHRMWAGLMVIQHLLSSAPSARDHHRSILDAALTGLVDDNPQPSVRFLQEWCVIRALSADPELEPVFWSQMDAAVEQRAGSMVSFLAVIGHTARCLSGSPRLDAFAADALPRVMPWAMAQHFTPRLYGSVVLDIVWKLCQASGCSQLVDKYSTVREVLRVAPEMPNARKNVEKLEQDFYLSVFHAQRHFTLETLFYHLPRLSHLAADEWMPVEWFDRVGSTIPHRNEESKLSECQPAEWVARAAGGAPSSPLATEEADGAGSVGNVQKKTTPWKQMLPDVDSLAVSSGRKKNSVESPIDLIVVASLIDRLPNLGGLCRTCEVLGVKHLVLSSLRMTEDRDFVSLSVSAEKWLNIIEVKPFQLLDYLKQLKQEGYCVVGAEQTAGSVELNSFTFPKKTALLLGNEKEGIPVELIQHLDVCVEVPQEGVIRSMNVHVTGAIFIWDYVRQQMGSL